MFFSNHSAALLFGALRKKTAAKNKKFNRPDAQYDDSTGNVDIKEVNEISGDLQVDKNGTVPAFMICELQNGVDTFLASGLYQSTLKELRLVRGRKTIMIDSVVYL